MSGKILGRFAGAEGNLEGLENVLLISSSGWKEVLDGIQAWGECSTIIQVYVKLRNLERSFPEMVRETLGNMEKSGFWAEVNCQLGVLCNQAVISKDILEKDLIMLEQLDSPVIKLNLQSVVERLKLSHRNVDDRIEKEGSWHRVRFPTDLVKSVSSPVLMKNKIRGGYENSEQYLETQFQLFSEDFAFHLRKGLHSQDNEALLRYGRVALLGPSQIVSGWQLSCEVQMKSEEFDFHDVDWDTSSRLMQGSLVVLTNHSDKTVVFGFIQSRQLVEKGRLTITLLNTDYLPGESSYELFEASVYFEAYKHVVHGLQSMKRVPFLEQIVEGKSQNLNDPKYLRGKLQVEIDASCLYQTPISPKGATKTIGIGQVVSALYAKDSVAVQASQNQQSRKKSLARLLDDNAQGTFLNPSQLDAFQSTLRQEISLVQGPPGTGKSFIAKALLSFLFKNQSLWKPSSGPILIICYTNRALDSILESLLMITPKFIRIGGGSKSECLENHNLHSIVKHMRESQLRGSENYKMEKHLRKEYMTLREQVNTMLSSGEPAGDLLKELMFLSKKIDHIQAIESLQILRRADFVGLTTTGAAKYHKLLQNMNSKILLLEEAGLVLEAHTITAIPQTCEHLIMIGDHMQLKPTISTHHLGTDYNLNISLFERLIKIGFPFTRLDVQHRMRPAISKIVADVFYPGLLDSPSVAQYPNVKGTMSSLFFLDHRMSEGIFEDTKSKSNLSEAKYLVKLASYFVEMGYRPESITILTTYVGQVRVIKQLVHHNQAVTDLGKVLVTVVDNYQGEENELILLSLVRSSEGGTIGYLNQSSRACVALSRAQHGLFVVGNMQALSNKSSTWAKIQTSLEQSNSIASTLQLVCPNHSDSVSNLSILSDFDPAQRCEKACNFRLSCGHVCQHQCHILDMKHSKEFQCQLPCKKKCSEGHDCQKRCHERCHPCQFTQRVTFEKCDHEADIPCATLRQPHTCTVKVKSKLECGHETLVACGEEQKRECQDPCPTTLDCGHACNLPCHFPSKVHRQKCEEKCEKVCDRGEHECSKPCWVPCAKCDVQMSRDLPCGHSDVLVPCWQPVQQYECVEKCPIILECGHQCKSFCYECGGKEQCSPCNVRVSRKSLPCGHFASNIKCSDAIGFKCKEQCSKSLEPCGHPCDRLCWEECGPCETLVNSSGTSSTACGHQAKIPCASLAKEPKEGEASSEKCSEVCGKIMRCGHECQAPCKNCLGGTLHVPCLKNCQRKLICGHDCVEPCGLPCSPCKKQKCLLQLCAHQPCKSLCEDPCATLCKVITCIHS